MQDYIKNLSQKQKIVIIIVITVIIAGVGYFAYATETEKQNETNLEIAKTEEKEDDEKENKEESKEEKIIVHLSGAVEKEGIIELNENSRMADAIEKAGGLKENACIDEINLAYKLEDGMKIYIPTKEECKKQTTLNGTETNTGKTNSGGASSNGGTSSTSTTNNGGTTINGSTSITGATSNGGTSITGTSSNKTTKQGKVNINTASQTELETLPGIGPSTALKILNYRKEKGKFKKIEDIKEVSGIGDSKYNKIKDLITI